LKSLIIIPILNEKKNIYRIASKIFSLKKNFLHILFVDDNSFDGSQAEILKLAKKKNVNYLFRKKRGLGSAHRDGILWAINNKFDNCITIDADGTHNPKLIIKMLMVMYGKLKTLHIVNTNRFLNKTSLNDWPVIRLLITKVRFILVKLFLRTDFDSSGGFRLYNLKLIDKKHFFLSKDNDYFYLIESLFYFEKLGYSIHEIPVKLKFRDCGSSKMSFYHVFGSFIKLLQLSLKNFNQKNYNK
jgi:dolichol-phosphate mannosyltransferase